MKTRHRTHRIVPRGALRAGLCVWALLASCPDPASAQQAQAPAPAPASPSAKAPAAPIEYQVGPGDLLAVNVFGVPELAQTPRVSNSGRIHLARVGVLDVYKLTAKQIESAVAAALTSKGLVNDPWVQVHVTQFRSNTVYVLGEVIQPGQYAITSRMSVLDLISMAEGLTPYADPIAFLYRLPDSSGTKDAAAAAAAAPERVGFSRDDVMPIDIIALTQGMKPELNVELRGETSCTRAGAVPSTTTSWAMSAGPGCTS